jgi:hypothetical protein
VLEQVPAILWRQEWVVHVRHAGTGEKVLAYLARYAFRIAIVHVLPPGFPKLRHYGLFSPAPRALLARAREQLLATSAPPSPDPGAPEPVTPPAPAKAPLPPCPVCGIGLLHVIEILPPCGRSP